MVVREMLQVNGLLPSATDQKCPKIAIQSCKQCTVQFVSGDERFLMIFVVRGCSCAEWDLEGYDWLRFRKQPRNAKNVVKSLLKSQQIQVAGRKSLDMLVEELNTCRSQHLPQIGWKPIAAE